MFWDDKIKGYPLVDNLIKYYPEIKNEVLTYINIPNILHDYPNYKIDGFDHIYQKYWKATPCTLLKSESLSKGSGPYSHGTDESDQIIAYLVSQFRKHCPITHSIIKPDEDLGVLTNSFISRLIPGSVINPHTGYSADYMRIHLGLVCDPECKMTVGKQTKAWEEGKILAFNDGDMHSVVHNGNSQRIILSVDVELTYIKQYMVP